MYSKNCITYVYIRHAPWHRVHRVAMIIFWRTFHGDGKIRVGGARPTPFSKSTIMYKVVVYALDERADNVHSPYFYSIFLFILWSLHCVVRN
jgi:hypothetical protein